VYIAPAGWLHFILASVGLTFLLVTFTPILWWWGKEMAWSVVGPGRRDPGRLRRVLIFLAELWDKILICAQCMHCGRINMSFRRTILSDGGNQTPVASEADFFRCHGAPDSVMQTVVNSRSTRENALLVYFSGGWRSMSDLSNNGRSRSMTDGSPPLRYRFPPQGTSRKCSYDQPN
jgi:hypothetical protein